MIFSLQFILIFAGYGAVSSLSGNYMEHYTKADDFQLGLYFMIPHFLHVARPFIGAQADRNRSHKKVYIWCALIAGISYVPYILLPFFLNNPSIAQVLTNKYRFWLLACSHVTGSVALNGCRTMSDALAKNYARRMNIEYVSLRKFAPVGQGIASLIFIRLFNEEWIMPDYVPAMILFFISMLVLSLLLYIWPDEYFDMISGSEDEELTALPTTRQILAKALGRMMVPFKRNSSYVKQLATMTGPQNKDRMKDLNTENDEKVQPVALSVIDESVTKKAHEQRKSLTLRQQLSILFLVLRRDFRISLAFVVLFFGGWTCRSVQNFVFVQLEDICDRKKTCHPGKLSGNVLAGISLLEFLTYVILNACRRFKPNRVLLLQVALLSLALHYYFFAFFVEHLRPRWFLVESLHGFEFAIFITTTLGWGYTFANEVEFIIPELKERGIIDQSDDLNLVKVSLVATMMSCMTLLFEGFGSTAGSFLYGLMIKRYSFSLAYKINGSISLLEFIVIAAALMLNRCLRFKPKMTKLKTESIQKKTAGIV